MRRVFPDGFRRIPGGVATPRARFEAIAVGSWLALQQRPDMATETPDVTQWIASEEFKEIVGSDGANVTKRLRARLHYVRDRLLGV